MVDVAFESVRVFAKTFVVVRAFDAVMFPDDFIESTFEKFP
jgi:hypothetical protein